jgi:hypothetical protein
LKLVNEGVEAMNIHRHKWERVEFFSPLLCCTCECGAAFSIVDGRAHYSPRKMGATGFIWKQVTVSKSAEVEAWAA